MKVSREVQEELESPSFEKGNLANVVRKDPSSLDLDLDLWIRI